MPLHSSARSEKPDEEISIRPAFAQPGGRGLGAAACPGGLTPSLVAPDAAGALFNPPGSSRVWIRPARDERSDS